MSYRDETNPLYYHHNSSRQPTRNRSAEHSDRTNDLETRGYANEVIIIIPDAPPSNPQSIDRRSFLRLSNLVPRGFANEERRILAQQAEAALPYYQEHKAEWQEWINLDIAETYAP